VVLLHFTKLEAAGLFQFHHIIKEELNLLDSLLWCYCPKIFLVNVVLLHFTKLEAAGLFQFHHIIKEELNLLDSFSKAPMKTKFH